MSHRDPADTDGPPTAIRVAGALTTLEGVVALFSRCAARGDAELAHAAAHRIGEAIIHLGDALLASERPADLAGDDLAAYDEVLREQAWGFATREGRRLP